MLRFSLFSLEFHSGQKRKCESEEVEFGLAPPDDAFPFVWKKGELMLANCRCPVLYLLRRQVCWTQPLWKEGVIASRLRMAAICCGSSKDFKRSVRPHAADGTTLKTPTVCLSSETSWGE